MPQSRTLFIGMNVHKDAIMVYENRLITYLRIPNSLWWGNNCGCC
jgi:hypothetical protein